MEYAWVITRINVTLLCDLHQQLDSHHWNKSSPMPIEISTWFTPFFRESKNMAPRIETNRSAFS